jgi:ATP-dependent DNA ligase
VNIDIKKLKTVNGYLQGNIKECTSKDDELYELPFEYKKKLSQAFYSLTKEDIEKKVNGSEFFVSKKVDGQLQLIVFDGSNVFMIGRNGTVRTGLPCLKDVKEKLKKNGIASIIAAAELYVPKENERSRVYDVVTALTGSTDTLGLAFFDILKIDGKKLGSEPFKTVYDKLNELFGKDGVVHTVETKYTKSKKDITAIFENLVDEKGEEGLVVRTDMPFIYKIKPRHTLDAVIVGYAEGINERKGMVKSLLFAFLREDGKYQITGRVGNRLTDDNRKEFFSTLKDMHVQSNYIETDSDGIAFHMVKPEIIIEICCNDIITETSSGKPLQNRIAEYENGYKLKGSISGAKLIFPVFERIREDKSNRFEDIRISQITDLVYVPEEKAKGEELKESEILFREVYRKSSKDKIMVQKFVVWKTNKENHENYPAYVMYYTNFSSGRKKPLESDIRISSSEKQIMNLRDTFIEKNVKKGWEKVT